VVAEPIPPDCVAQSPDDARHHERAA